MTLDEPFDLGPGEDVDEDMLLRRVAELRRRER